jgi:hypothetical protein
MHRTRWRLTLLMSFCTLSVAGFPLFATVIPIVAGEAYQSGRLFGSMMAGVVASMVAGAILFSTIVDG